MSEAQTPNYSDFLSLEARTRARSAIKQLRPYFEIPGMISVCTVADGLREHGHS